MSELEFLIQDCRYVTDRLDSVKIAHKRHLHANTVRVTRALMVFSTLGILDEDDTKETIRSLEGLRLTIYEYFGL